MCSNEVLDQQRNTRSGGSLSSVVDLPSFRWNIRTYLCLPYSAFACSINSTLRLQDTRTRITEPEQLQLAV